jgi:hypothetical protein
MEGVLTSEVDSLTLVRIYRTLLMTYFLIACE